MPAEEFKQNVEALAAKRLEKPKRLMGLSSKFWGEINNRQFHFHRGTIKLEVFSPCIWWIRLVFLDDDEVNILRGISKEKLLKFFDDVITLDAPKRRKLTVRVFSEEAKNRHLSGEARDSPQMQKAKGDLAGGDSALQVQVNLLLYLQRRPVRIAFLLLHLLSEML